MKICVHPCPIIGGYLMRPKLELLEPELVERDLVAIVQREAKAARMETLPGVL